MTPNRNVGECQLESWHEPRAAKDFVNLWGDMESFLEIYLQCLQHEFKDQEQIAQRSATIEKPYFWTLQIGKIGMEDC